MSRAPSEGDEIEDELDDLADMTDFDDECGEGGPYTPCPSKGSTSLYAQGDMDAEAKKRLLAEYQEVIREIDNQNRVVNTLKMNIVDKALKPCKNRCDERELKNLRCILERENTKLQCLLRKAVTLQEEDPTRLWEHIPLATTFEEDNMPLQLSMLPCPGKTTCAPEATPTKSVCGGSGDLKDKKIQDLLKRLLSEVKCDQDPNKNKENLKKLAKILKNCREPENKPCEKEKKKRSKKKKSHDALNKELSRSYNMQNRLANDNSRLEGDRFHLQNEVIQRDQTIDSLQNKINLLQNELQSLCREKAKVLNAPTTKCEAKENRKLQSLELNITTMENCMEKLKLEMNHLQRERSQWENQVSKGNCAVHDKGSPPCPDIRIPKYDELNELKDNYAYLLAEYAKKDAELKEMHMQPAKCRYSNDDSKGNDRAEMELLKDKLNDLQDEADEFKCLIKEQSEQLVEYQNKYLAAQQKVEEQKCLLNKLEISNKKIEDQINLEIRRIKEKFQEKLKELVQLPKLLENEQLKLAAVCKEKDNLESKLRLVCRELKTLKAASANDKDVSPDQSKRIRDLEKELDSLRKEVDTLRKEKQILCDKLCKTKGDLDLLRAESAKIVARTKERAEQTRCALQQRLDCVEKELAQCRATACLSISDREEVIREMQGQLNTIACNFETAQNQIRTLKGHIAYLSKDSADQCN